jgi:hypothetical protein
LTLTAFLYGALKFAADVILPWWGYFLVFVVSTAGYFAGGAGSKSATPSFWTGRRHRSGHGGEALLAPSRSVRPTARGLEPHHGYERRSRGYLISLFLCFLVGAGLVILARPAMLWWQAGALPFLAAGTNASELQAPPPGKPRQEAHPQDVCRAAIAALMGHDPRLLTAKPQSGGVIWVSYVRPLDRSRWTYRCKLDGINVIWGPDMGPWRTSESDGRVTYVLDGKGGVRIVHRSADRSKDEMYYPADFFGPSQK